MSVDKLGAASSRAPRPLLQTRAVSKRYPGVLALDQIDFDLRAGEVHILFGENGAGKSTLISIISGANQPSGGEILMNGERVEISSVHDARELGICAVFQEFSLVPQMTVEENIFLGDEFTRGGLLSKEKSHGRAVKILDDLEFPLDPRQRVQRLTRAEQQMVEIAKAFRSEPEVIILDEPTASLTDHETNKLFDLIGKLKARGVGVVYITHRMSEIARIGDRITVLRDGKYIDTVDAKTTHEDELVRLMSGRVVDEIFPQIQFSPGNELLRVEGLRAGGGGVNGADIYVRRGEIVGLAGLVGSGKSRIAQAIFGAMEVEGGSITFKGEDVTDVSISGMLERGFLYLPANRRDDGLMMMRPCRENISLAALNVRPFSNGWLLNNSEERRIGLRLASKLHLSPLAIERSVEHFSGGNQQKIMLARALTREFDLLVFDEPTVGVDVGTRSAIYRFIGELCESGAAVILISSDLPEILHLSHRAYVFYRGQAQVELQQFEITEENVLRRFFEREAV